MSRRIRIQLAALAAGLLLANSGRADRIDVEMNKRLPEIVAQLKKTYKTVGVLRFRAQDDGQKESFNSPLSGRMAERLENWLVMHAGQTEATALGVLHDVGPTAARAKINDWYTNPAERKKLFTLSYPMAWGDKSVRADAFLTGKIELGKGRSKTTVTVEYFDKNDPAKLVRLASFTETTTATVLRDMGYNFALSRGAMNELKAMKRSGPEAVSKLAIREVNLSQPSQPPGDEPKPDKPPQVSQPQVSARNVCGIEVQLLVNGKPAEIHPAGAQGDPKQWEVTSPPKDSKFAIRLRNTTKKHLGVALRLNGYNTIGEKPADQATAQKWNIPGEKSYLIEGFLDLPLPQDGGLKWRPFKVLVGQEAQEYKGQQMGDKKGLIEVDVFEAGVGGGDADEAEMLIAPRGLPPTALKKERSTFQGLKSALLKNAKLKTQTASVRQGSLVVKRELIVPDEEAITAEGKSIKTQDLPNPMLVGGLTIRVVPGQNGGIGE